MLGNTPGVESGGDWKMSRAAREQEARTIGTASGAYDVIIMIRPAAKDGQAWNGKGVMKAVGSRCSLSARTLFRCGAEGVAS